MSSFKLFQNNLEVEHVKTIRYVLQNISVFGKHSELFSNMPRLFCSPKCSENFSLFRNILECSEIFQKFFFRNIPKVFWNINTFLKSVLKHSDFFSRLSCFHTIPKLSVYPETFKFVLETFQNKVLSENNV